MKHPLSVIIITKDPDTKREVHRRYDSQTAFPRLKLLAILLKAILAGI
jgi:hypothetical protein